MIREATLPRQGETPSPTVARGRRQVVESGLAPPAIMRVPRVQRWCGSMCGEEIHELLDQGLFARAGGANTRLKSPPM